MEREFLLHPNQPLTIEVIQKILAHQVTLSYSSDFKQDLNPVSLPQKEGITPAELQALAIGLGSETPTELTPLMLLLLADFFTKNPVNGNQSIISRILEFYDYEVWPQIFSHGLYSTPTAHLILPVFGGGKVYYQGYLLKAADVHDIFSWQPLPWPDNLPIALTSTSFLGVSNLLYSFIQLKKLLSYFQVLLPLSAPSNDTEIFFPEQLEHLESQLNSFLATSEAQAKHVNGLIYQVVKLFSKFGEHILENLAPQRTNESFAITINNQVSTNSAHLLSLMEVLSQENHFLFEGNFDSYSDPSPAFSNQLMMQPYFFLKNVEKIVAIGTLINLSAAIKQDNTVIETVNLKSIYRNQVIDVLQVANFDEIIRKTIAFMYAQVSS